MLSGVDCVAVVVQRRYTVQPRLAVVLVQQSSPHFVVAVRRPPETKKFLTVYEGQAVPEGVR